MKGKKGAVPIPYIIALILGIAVVVIFAYWIFTSGGSIGETQCIAIGAKYCQDWYIASKTFDTSVTTTLPISGGCTKPSANQCKNMLGITP